jgi:hypothetical protein
MVNEPCTTKEPNALELGLKNSRQNTVVSLLCQRRRSGEFLPAGARRGGLSSLMADIVAHLLCFGSIAFASAAIPVGATTICSYQTCTGRLWRPVIRRKAVPRFVPVRGDTSSVMLQYTRYEAPAYSFEAHRQSFCVGTRSQTAQAVKSR